MHLLILLTMTNHPKAIWFFGLSGSGKSTLANKLVTRMFDNGQNSFLLDGDIIRTGINNNLGFSREDRKENVRRIAEMCKILLQVDVIPIVAAITPYESDRLMIQNILGKDNIILMHVSCPLEECEKRDPKGLYKKARKGEIPNFTGVSDVFELPKLNHLIIETNEKSIKNCLDKALEHLEESKQEITNRI